jgi:tetratricopeptide (TPR) repeat protein
LLRSLGEILVALQRGEEALPYLEEAADLFDRSQDPGTEALLRSKIALIHEGRDRHSAAQVAWERVRDLCRGAGDLAGEGRALEGSGRTARRQEDVDRALSSYRQALRLAAQTGDEAKQAELHNTMGILGWHRGAYADALAHYEQALRIYELREEPIHAGLMLNSIGATLHRMGRAEEAVRSLERAVRLHRRTEQPQFEAYALGVLGDVHFGMDRHTDAVPCYEASLLLRPELGDSRGEGWMLHRLARVYAAQGLAGRSRDAAMRATAIATELGDQKLSRNCRPFTAMPGA